MAAAFFNALADGTQNHAISAGTKPAAQVHPTVVAVMREVGINLAKHHPQLLTPDLAASAQTLVTMGCGEECPLVPGLEVIDWQIPDPKDQPIDRVREIRDEILEQVKALLQQLE